MKKIIILFVAVFFSSFFLNGIVMADFKDLSKDNPYFDAIIFLKNNNIINGHSDGTFKPNDLVNRAEALKIVLIGTGISLDGSFPMPNFSDVKKDDWYIGFLAKGIKDNIVNGNPDGTFAPGRGVNKAELLKMLLLSAKIDLSKHKNLTEAVSRDVGPSDWFAPYFSYGKTVGIVFPDLNNNLEPGKFLTRGEVAEIVYRLIITVKGGDAQKFLSIAESSLVSVLVYLNANDIENALSSSNNAVFYSEQALSLKSEESIVKGAVKVSNAFRELCYAYKAGLNGNVEELKSFVVNAKKLADEGLNFNSGLQDLRDRIFEQGDLLLSQI
ncbi:MAG: S-layer homology domain-containing protein [Candidatus Gracilibacteria bacterium]|jgi:hypothetical protein|nr:S-layer homology domain-containing protein [Candidatus Gracilibacteria bacterium]